VPPPLPPRPVAKQEVSSRVASTEEQPKKAALTERIGSFFGTLIKKMGGIWSDRAMTPQFLGALPTNEWLEADGENPYALAEKGDDAVEYAKEMGPLPTKLREVQNYGTEAVAGAIRDAMSYPNDETKLTAALTDLGPSVDCIAGWYDAGESLGELIPRLANDVEKEFEANDPSRKAASIQAVVRVLGFILEFDAAKMGTPSIQNDFSFVRRAQNKNAALTSGILDPNKASVCSMFIAQSSPMVARVADALDTSSATKIAKVAHVLSVAASDKRTDPKQRDACLTAMTAAFVLYDRAAKNFGGAFGPASPVNAKRIATAIRKFAPEQRLNVLFGAFMYSTVNYSKHASQAVQNIVDR